MMWHVYVWRKLTETQALKATTGKYELAFFEPVYRVFYILGFSQHDRGFYRLYSISVKILISLFVAGELWHLSTMSASLDTAIANMSVTFINLIAIYRYQNMTKHREGYKDLAKSMESPFFDVSTPRRRTIVEFWLTNNEKYTKLLLGLGTCTLAAWFVYPLLDDLEYNLVVTIRLPFDYRSPLRYFFTYGLVMIAFNYAAYFVMMNDVMLQSYLLHQLCQFQILGDCFESIVGDCSIEFDGVDPSHLYDNASFQKRFTDRLRILVKQHQFVLNKTQDLRTLLSTPMLCQLAASSLLICFAGYQVIASASDGIANAKFLMSLLYLGYNMFQLFVLCRWCGEIKTQSEQIRDAIYRCGWERGLVTMPGVRQRLLLTMVRAARPLVLTAGGLYDLSLTSYAALVKTSYSALTMLMRVQRQ